MRFDECKKGTKVRAPHRGKTEIAEIFDTLIDPDDRQNSYFVGVRFEDGEPMYISCEHLSKAE